ncbi:MAG: hypothetical protein GC182_05250 [Rhodopseudomonas sp.]|nr:hypothetical protein [Rhodopseudomonas sp.]
MKKLMELALAAALVVTPTVIGASPAHAEDGQIAAGVAGGLLGGMLLGGALAQRPHYYGAPPPPPVYYEEEPVYVRHCYWTRGEPYWDDWSGRWRRPRVRVCE